MEYRKKCEDEVACKYASTSETQSTFSQTEDKLHLFLKRWQVHEKIFKSMVVGHGNLISVQISQNFNFKK